MPCRDYQSDYSRVEYIDNPEIKNRLDQVTKLLCTLCTALQGQELFNHILKQNPELRTWWEKHQEDDKKEEARLLRIKNKQLLKKKALSKLTLEERKALGL